MQKELRAYLKANRLSQYRLAVNLGVDRSLVTYWLQGRNKPNKANMLKLAQMTGIPMERML